MDDTLISLLFLAAAAFSCAVSLLGEAKKKICSIQIMQLNDSKYIYAQWQPNNSNNKMNWINR